MSPIYPKLKEAGAVFGQVMGYERPAYFSNSYKYGKFILPKIFVFVSNIIYRSS